jgi:signal transduction histidine kinase
LRVATGEWDLVVDLYNGERVGARASLADFIAVPLAARGRVFGIWLFARSSASRRSYVDEERAACEELARRAALAIDNIRLYQDAENANHAKDHFLAALSHELRTPLTPALLLSETLQGAHSCSLHRIALSFLT